jgi:uncharacterized membrane protein
MQSEHGPEPDMERGGTDAGPPAGLHVEQYPDCVIIRILPNRSLTRIGLLVAAGACLSALMPATLLTLLLGAWPMLPVLGLEVVVVVATFAWLRRHFDDYEEITLDAEQVAIRRVHGARTEDRRFQRYWIRLALQPSTGGLRPPQLWLCSHGQSVEVGREAGADTRRALAAVLMHDCGISPAYPLR